MLRVISEEDRYELTMSISQQSDITIQIADIFDYLAAETRGKQLIFIDPVVLSVQEKFLALEAKRPRMVLVPTSLQETNKDIDSLLSVIGVLESNAIGRRHDMVMAIGGGALLDTVSFAASIYRRGIDIVKVPSTLLGVVDASVGIKTGINHNGFRNRLGSYHFDFNVVIDPILMKGLPKNLIRQGLGEIFKIAIIKSERLFSILVDSINDLESYSFYQSEQGQEILSLSVELMLEELHNNPREKELMRCVDYGHSFSPLVEMESISRMETGSLPHGYSVAYDCLLSACIATNRGLLDEKDFLQIFNLVNAFDFDLSNNIYNDWNLMWSSFMEMTKHRGGNQNLPVPKAIGQHEFIQDLTFEEMKAASISFARRLSE